MDISKLVEDLNTEILSKNNSRFSQRIYKDEPIIRTAASIILTEPQEYRLMRKLGVTYDRTLYSESRIFYEQAKFMEKFEDHFEDKTPFMSFYPTYRVMSLRQQRTYFTWRTKVRNGAIEQIDLSYVFIYLYELLNLIGVKSGAEALEKIRAFVDSYAAFDSTPQQYASVWLHDLIIYYDLPASLLPNDPISGIRKHFETLSRPGDYSDDRLFDSIKSVATYNIENSRFYRANPEDFIAVTTAVYREMSAFFEKNRVNTFYETLIGKCRSFPYDIFESAVFYDRRRNENRVYEFGALDRYEFVSGRWFHYRPSGGVAKSKKMGAFLRNVDAVMREVYQYPFELKNRNSTKHFEQVIRASIRQLSEEKKAVERRVVTIDFSVLDHIRAASEATKEKILTRDERDDLTDDLPVIAKTQYAASEAENDQIMQSNENLILTADESELLQALLNGTDPSPALKSRGVIPSVIADRLNDKLFDRFGDTVIEFDGDAPSLVEDYRAELQELAENLI